MRFDDLIVLIERTTELHDRLGEVLDEGVEKLDDHDGELLRRAIYDAHRVLDRRAGK